MSDMEMMGRFAEIVRKAVGTEVFNVPPAIETNVPYIVIDKGREVKALDPLVHAFERACPAPYRRRGIYKAADVTSLLAWMGAHCVTDAPVFAAGAEKLATDWRAPELALIGIGNYSSGAAAEWHDFGVRFAFLVTASFMTWAKHSGVAMDQNAFAEFIETRLYDLSAPLAGEDVAEPVTRALEAFGGAAKAATPSAMIRLSTGIKIDVSEKVEVALNRATGEAVMRFSEEHTGEGGRPMTIPKLFLIRISVFFGEPPQLIACALRYRNAGGGKIVWTYELIAPELVVSDAFEAACKRVKTAGRTLYFGSPDMP